MGVFGIFKSKSGSHIIVDLEPVESYKNIRFLDGFGCSKFILGAKIIEKLILDGLGGFLRHLGDLLGRSEPF